MAREYMIFEVMSETGAELQIAGIGEPVEEEVPLHAVSDRGRIREAEGIINERFYGLEPFPGFDWVEMGDGWRTTDHDLRPES